MSDVKTHCSDILEERKNACADSSDTASLDNKLLYKILEKVAEEAVETILAAKDAELSHDTSNVVYETAVLWLDSLVGLAKLGVRPEAVIDELARRFNMSGLDEKAARPKD